MAKNYWFEFLEIRNKLIKQYVEKGASATEIADLINVDAEQIVIIVEDLHLTTKLISKLARKNRKGR